MLSRVCGLPQRSILVCKTYPGKTPYVRPVLLPLQYAMTTHVPQEPVLKCILVRLSDWETLYQFHFLTGDCPVIQIRAYSLLNTVSCLYCVSDLLLRSCGQQSDPVYAKEIVCAIHGFSSIQKRRQAQIHRFDCVSYGPAPLLPVHDPLCYPIS